ncbi:hypothetical protein Fmac_008364 [Flemingia macrophylla]|uniref:Uncharacterized protein n=1 Tax=Flemingia macrophylla TaxID=520843 RepID=A0ABD1MX88_9FABA
MASNFQQFNTRNDVIIIKGVHDVATDTSAETKNLERKLDALVNLVSQLAVNQKSASSPRVFGIRSSNDHHTNQTTTAGEAIHLIKKMASNSQQFGVRYDVIIIRGFHHVATDTSSEIRKLEGKLDALVNLVTQLTVNQKSTSNAIVFGINFSQDHHRNVCLSLR